MGAWIETIFARNAHRANLVAPYVGAWIETSGVPSSPLQSPVAPYVGAWIETLSARVRNIRIRCRTLRGCVD